MVTVVPHDPPQPRVDHLIERRTLLRGVLSTTALGAIAACTRPAADQADGPTPSQTDASPNTTSTSTTSTSTASTTTSPPTSTTSTSTSTTSTTTSTSTTSSTSTTEPVPETTIAEQVGQAPPGAYDREALYVALYGHPGSTILGVLGEQDAAAGVLRALEVAAAYEGFGRRVVAAFEIIASVASAEAGSDGDFSNEFSFEKFEPHLTAAAANGIHVVFDLQPGRARFPDQAREYEALWLQPHASIALDPEWRVGPTEQPGGGRIGTVDASEVNETIDYLDGLITTNGLPPKMCIVHQFTSSMITNKQQIRGTANVQVVIQMDGFGSLELKRGSWANTVSDLPAGALTGWKNFYDEDTPTPTPSETMANEPAPSFVSFQ